MNGIIIYTSKTGVTEDVAKTIQKKSNIHFDLIKLQKRRELPQIQNYDCVVIGTPTYVGRAPKIVRDFSQTHLSSLLEKPLFLFIVGGEANVDLDTSLPLSFPKEFLSHLQSKKYLGGEFRFDKMNALSRFILRAVEKNKEKANPGQGKPTIQYESIAQFCLDLDSILT